MPNLAAQVLLNTRIDSCATVTKPKKTNIWFGWLRLNFPSTKECCHYNIMKITDRNRQNNSQVIIKLRQGKSQARAFLHYVS